MLQPRPSLFSDFFAPAAADVAAPPDAQPGVRCLRPEHAPHAAWAGLALCTGARSLRLTWKWWRGSGLVRARPQVVGLCLWPTALCVPDVAGERWVLAGKCPRSGRSEVWSCSIAGFPPLDRSLDGPRPSYAVRLRADPVPRGPGQAGDGIRFLEPLRGLESTHVLVHDDNGLSRLALATGEQEVLLAADEAPEIASPRWCSLWSGEHPELGFVYVLRAYGAHGEQLVLLDPARDGTLRERHLCTTPQEWRALGLGHPHADWSCLP